MIVDIATREVRSASNGRRIERDLARITQRIRAAAGQRLVALLLVGGYGRGEGGTVGEGEHAAAHNDYDLVAVCPESSRPLAASLHAAAGELSRELGVDVDVHVVSPELVAHPPKTLFWLDVSLGGRRVLFGDESIVATSSPIAVRDIPLDECARLLANRATGIALSRLAGPSARPLEAARHIHKAVLACGDARMVAADRYVLKVADRARVMADMSRGGVIPDGLAAAYRDAAAFRMRPDRWPLPSDIDAWFDDMSARIAAWHMEFESLRLGQEVEARSFSRRTEPVYLAHVDRMRLGLPSALRATARGKAPLFPYLGHPRERLARVSVALAYLDASVAMVEAKRLFGLDADAPASVVHAALIALRDVGA